MAHWVNKIEARDLHTSFDNDEIKSIKELGTKFAERIRTNSCYNSQKESLEPIAKKFEKVRTVEGFDKVIRALYDWGDISLDGKFNGRKMCWIEF